MHQSAINFTLWVLQFKGSFRAVWLLRGPSWNSHQGLVSLCGALIRFSAQSTQGKHYVLPDHHVGHDISPVSMPAELALNSEEKKQLIYLTKGC